MKPLPPDADRGFLPLTRLLSRLAGRPPAVSEGAVRIVTHGRRVPADVEIYAVAAGVYGFWVAFVIRLIQAFVPVGIAGWLPLLLAGLLGGFVLVHLLALATALALEIALVRPKIIARSRAGDVHSCLHAALITAISIALVRFGGAGDWSAWIASAWLLAVAVNGLIALATWLVPAARKRP